MEGPGGHCDVVRGELKTTTSRDKLVLYSVFLRTRVSSVSCLDLCVCVCVCVCVCLLAVSSRVSGWVRLEAGAEDQDTLWKVFLNRVRSHLHVVMALSPCEYRANNGSLHDEGSCQGCKAGRHVRRGRRQILLWCGGPVRRRRGAKDRAGQDID